jgi:hypothetical protein
MSGICTSIRITSYGRSGRGCHRLAAGGGDVGRVAEPTQQGQGQLAVEGVVLDEQQPQRVPVREQLPRPRGRNLGGSRLDVGTEGSADGPQAARLA